MPVRDREKKRLYMAKWRTRNREKIRKRQPVYSARYRARHPERVAAYEERIKGRKSLRTRGMDRSEYDAMLFAQDFRCAICRSPHPRNASTTRFAIDHCHETDQIRGLLCCPCNRGLGFMGDDPEILYNAIRYLAKRAFNSGLIAW